MIFVVMICFDTCLFVILLKWRPGLSYSFWGKVHRCDLYCFFFFFFVAWVLIRLAGSSLAIYKEHHGLFQLVLIHPGS